MNHGEADYLLHYGVKGMKWGVIRERKESNRRKVAEKAKARSDRASSEIERIRANGRRAGDGIVRRNPDAKIKDLERKRDRADQDAAAAEKGKLTPTEKKVLKGAAVAATVLAAYGLYAAADSGKLNAAVASFRPGDLPFKKNEKLKNLDMDPKKAALLAHKINPEYGKLGTTKNCRRCTLSYEMTRRGYQVEATKTLTGRNQNMGGIYSVLTKDKVDIDGPKQARGVMLKGALDTTFGRETKASRFVDFASRRDITRKAFSGDMIEDHKKMAKAFSAFPDKSRGEIEVSWRGGGLHSMAWEVMKGKPVIVDAQTHEVYSSIADFMTKKGDMVSNFALTRLDDVDLNPDILKRWMK